MLYFAVWQVVLAVAVAGFLVAGALGRPNR
jgi:hypothetical protein